ncbi:5'/3'-nucleotidase SurE [Nocardioides sp. CN2-186]|uniref:5'/3'-nucleotidase SurE n=1 Tax=Nocardioides tweenelious TaxID=3156607 RepID=UPI0032B5D400
MPRRSRILAAALAAIAALVVGLLAGQAGAAQVKPPANVKGLKILLTNDDSVQGVKADGEDGKGLYELRKALCAAGADVIVVGPWGQQSGQGGRITTSRTAGLTVTKATVPEAYAGDCASAASAGPVYGVCNSNTACVADSPSASPADTVRIGVKNFLPATYWPKGPDVVLTGINWGQNVGTVVTHSGTTNAAVTAHELGVPAIAFSEALPSDIGDLIACATQGIGCPEYTAAAAFGVKLLGKVRGAGLLKPSTLLNVNYPHLADGQKVGKPVLNVLGNGDMTELAWSGSATKDGATYSLGIPTDRKSTNKNADTEALRAGKISIVPMDGDWTLSAAPKSLQAIVKALG